MELQGLHLQVRRLGPLNARREQETRLPPAVDILCEVAVATSLSTSATDGCSVVQLAFGETGYDYAAGMLPPIKVGVGAVRAIAGVLVEGQLGSGAAGALAAGDKVWVRIRGVHSYVKDAKGVAQSLPVEAATGGSCTALSTSGIPFGVHVGAYDAGGGPGEVLLRDPLNLLTVM